MRENGRKGDDCHFGAFCQTFAGEKNGKPSEKRELICKLVKKNTKKALFLSRLGHDLICCEPARIRRDKAPRNGKKGSMDYRHPEMQQISIILVKSFFY